MPLLPAWPARSDRSAWTGEIARLDLALHSAVARGVPHSTSFPSGHAASAPAFATGVGLAPSWAGLPFTTGVSLDPYARVHAGAHYPSDGIAGSIIGSAMAPAIVAAPEHDAHPNRAPTEPTVIATITVPNTYDRSAWCSARRRTGLWVRSGSEVWNVIPIVNARYAKSR